jgi:hypothetical protein
MGEIQTKDTARRSRHNRVVAYTKSIRKAVIGQTKADGVGGLPDGV